MGAEDSAIGVAFVDDHVAQCPKEPSPVRVPGQQRMVHQVGVGQHHMCVVTNPASLVRRGVPVIGRNPNPRQGP